MNWCTCAHLSINQPTSRCLLYLLHFFRDLHQKKERSSPEWAESWKTKSKNADPAFGLLEILLLFDLFKTGTFSRFIFFTFSPCFSTPTEGVVITVRKEETTTFEVHSKNRKDFYLKSCLINLMDLN